MRTDSHAKKNTHLEGDLVEKGYVKGPFLLEKSERLVRDINTLGQTLLKCAVGMLSC